MNWLKRYLLIDVLFVCAVTAIAVWLLCPGIPFSARRALNNADRYELLALYPSSVYAPPGDRFYGHTIIGRASITDRAVRKKLNDALASGAAEWNIHQKACFNPRHGIRVIHNGTITDFVICFECCLVEVYRGDQMINSFPISDAPQDTFNKVLQQYGVPIPPERWEPPVETQPSTQTTQP